jgi:hypothetical protein
MAQPPISAPIVDSSIDTSYYQTMVVVGQSNTATAGLYKDIELMTKEAINSKFGANSHLAACLRDVETYFENSLVKPKVIAASYQDNTGATARVLESVVAGTSTEEKTLKIVFNSLNPDRISCQQAAILSLRNTESAYCGEYSAGSLQWGAPKNAGVTFNPKLTKITANDCIVEVVIPKGSTAAAAATLINTAINAKADCIYSSTVVDDTLTITARHKGSIGNLFGFEVIKKTIPAGLTITTTEDTAGSGVVDASAVLDLTDDENVKLKDLKFNFFVAPISYSVANVVTDAMAKFKNVTFTNNESYSYTIHRATAIDTSNSTAINNLAIAEPVELNGVIKTLSVLKTVGLAIKGVYNYSEQVALGAKQFTPILYKRETGVYSVGAFKTLANDEYKLFKDFENLFAAITVRKFIVEKRVPELTDEKSFTSGQSTENAINKENVVTFFMTTANILNGSIVSTEFSDRYAGLIENSAEALARTEQLLNSNVKFDKASKQLALELANTLINPIRSIFIINSFR